MKNRPTPRHEWLQICSFVELKGAHDQLATAKAFFSDNYIKHLTSIVEADTKEIKNQLAAEPSPKKQKLEPRVATDFDDNEHAAMKRKNLLGKCTKQDLAQVDKRLKEQYRQEIYGPSAAVHEQVITEPDAEYVADHYWSILEELPTLRLKPRVHPSTNSTTAETEAERYALLDKSSPSDLERTEEAVLKRLKAELERVPLKNPQATGDGNIR